MDSRSPHPTPDPRPTGQGRRKRGVLPPSAPRPGQPRVTPAPGGRREESKVGLSTPGTRSQNCLVSPTRGPAAGKLGRVGRVGQDLPPAARPHCWVGRGVGSRGNLRFERSSGRAPGPPATYQQALHVNGRARVSDQRLQLPLAARARAVPRHGLGGAGHLPRRRGPAHAAARPALRSPRSGPAGLGAYRRPRTTGSGRGSARAHRAPGAQRPGALGLWEARPAPGAARSRRRPRPSVRFAPPGPLLRRELPQDSEGGSGEVAPPPPGPPGAVPPSGVSGKVKPRFQTTTAAASRLP